jgi:hypothetical protein
VLWEVLLIPNSILKVLSSIQKNQVQALLMGGQACVLYGAAEFSRDTDFAILSSNENLDRLLVALAELKAHVIAIPPFDSRYLEKGHAVHFRCEHPDADNMRIDVMSRMRGVDPFAMLWERRSTVEIGPVSLDLMSLPDLVKAKKTQRDKDWPMIRRLVEANFFQNKKAPTPEQVRFWFDELRSPNLLIELCGANRDVAFQRTHFRPLLKLAIDRQAESLEQAIAAEEHHERDLDRAYWAPLMAELRELRRGRRQ